MTFPIPFLLKASARFRFKATFSHMFSSKRPSTRIRAAFPSLFIALITSSGCTKDEEADPTLPPQTPETTPTPTPLPVWDDGNPSGNLEPEHFLTKEENGTWYLTPSGGPYDAMTGTLEVKEYIDSPEDFSCQLQFALTGSRSLLECDGCSFVFLVTYALIEGEPSACLSSDIPSDGDQLTLAWQPGDEGEGALYLDYQDTGEWVYWYDGELENDILELSWISTFGLIVE